MFLRSVGDSSFLDLDLEAPPNPSAYPRSAVFTVRNPEGAASRLRVDMTTQRMVVRIPLPESQSESVYELSWQFDYSACTSPILCTSGTIHTARFHG
jgi:hypothetical protein